MLHRLSVYFKEMFPLIPRFFLALIVFNEVYFLVLLNNRVDNFSMGIQEFVGIYTVFAFYMWLRIADDFKDYELDKRLFAHGPLASGRVYKKDLIIVCSIVQATAVVLNLLFMNNFIFFVFLYSYGFLMSIWFFHKHKIQKNLMLALVTHNPVQMIVNIYVISFTCIKYTLNPFNWITFFVTWTLYFPSLIWEISRKIRAPKEETEYVTYSKLFGHVKATRFILVVTLADILTNMILIWNINKFFIALLVILVSWMTAQFIIYIRNPDKFRIVEKVELYTYIQELLMLVAIGFTVFKNQI